MKRILECSVLLRVYTMIMSALYCYTAFNSPDMVVYKIAHVDSFSTYTMVVLGALAAIGMIDMLINDILPDRYVFLDALKTRHLVLMGIPLCFAIQIFKCVSAGFPHSIIPYFAVYTLLVPLSAFVDVQKRHLKDLA